MTFGITLAEQLTMAASASMFYIAIDYEKEPNMKEAASNENIEIHQLFRGTIAQRKTSGDLTRTGF